MYQELDRFFVGGGVKNRKKTKAQQAEDEKKAKAQRAKRKKK